ncbi:MAG: substrate-binding domain-containing protein, partial [Prevotella sp.]|nr:substrate-binding domain-containing protein [Prevotella sp.]
MNKGTLNHILCLAVAMLWVGLLTTSCTKKRPKYVIGVSQCSQDIWRDKLNRELQVGAYFHDGVELRFASADDSDERQIEQIDQFVSDGIDLLIVAPNQVATVTPAIDRAYDRGIPVIVFDRKTNTEKFTAYIGADNRKMGRMMGEYVAAQLKGRGRVLEIMGLQGSSPAIER